MNNRTNRCAWLLATSALFAASGGAAMAQTAPAAPAADSNQLGEVVVTATRQTSTVNRVALAITAVTQAALEKQGAKTIDDLSRSIPSLTVHRASGEQNANISIRGLGSSLGSATTGIYLDDTPLQKRDFPGQNTGNGTPLPQLYDLDRVEVLRGPQGTLFGGSAEGGALRFITPTPSLTTYSGSAKIDGSLMPGVGAPSYEAGFAAGGPIVQDKLGFRASIWQRHSGGYNDEVSLYTGKTIAQDINGGLQTAARLSVLWAPTNDLKVTPAFYYSQDHQNGSDTFYENIPQFTINSGVFLNKGTINGVAYDFPDKVFQGGVYGPFNQFGPYKSGVARYPTLDGAPFESGKTATLMIPTLTVDYAFPFMSVKSITSYLSDINKGGTTSLSLTAKSSVLPSATNAAFVTIASHTGENIGTPVVGGSGGTNIIVAGNPDTYNTNAFDNSRHTVIEELRFSSAPSASKLSWVGGMYYSDTRQHSVTYQVGDAEQTTLIYHGISQAWLQGATELYPGNSSQREIYDHETELAGYGEANYMITDKLKATAGVRVDSYTVDYNQATGSVLQGAPTTFVGKVTPAGTVTNVACGINPISCASAAFHVFPNVAGDDPFTRFIGTQKATPVTPKFGLSYQMNSRTLFYLTAAQGYRTGGLNQPATANNCGPDLAALGLTGIGTPLTYNSDSVWSYEAGSKLGLFDGRVQVNSSLFHIDWKNPQLSVTLKCGQTYIQNTGMAVSQGADVQTQGRFGPWLLGASVSYTDARYTQAVSLPGAAGAAPVVIANKGDELGAPMWQYNINAEYDFHLTDKYSGYIRGDYAFSSEYKRQTGIGTVGYDALTNLGSATHFANARMGVNFSTWDVSLYVKNLTASQDILSAQHTAGAALVTATTFRPREVGMSVGYRF